MFGLGFGELLLIAVVLLLVFGSSKLPQLGQGLGESVKSFRKAFQSVRSDVASDKPPAPPSEKQLPDDARLTGRTEGAPPIR